MTQKHIALLCSIVIGVSSGSGILNHYCTGGYKIVVEGKTIGYVEDSSDYEQALSVVNDTLRKDFGEEYTLSPDAEMKGVILDKNLLSTKDELHDNIARLSDYMTDGYTISLNGEDLCAFKTKDDALETLSLMRSRYAIDGGVSSIRENTEIISKQVSAAAVMTAEDAAQMLIDSGKLNVKSTVNSTYHITKEYDTVEEEDDTLLKGSQKVVCEGEVGEYAVSSLIEYNNGVLVGESILSETVISEPVTKVVKVGTKELPNTGTGTFIKPSQGSVTSGFGGRWGRMHNGIDIGASTGTPIKASDTGVVVFSGYQGSYGNLIKIDHKNGYVTYYAHCSRLVVNEGETVTQGQLIGYVGNTGNSTGPHCHFEIQKNGVPQNPMNYIN